MKADAFQAQVAARCRNSGDVCAFPSSNCPYQIPRSVMSRDPVFEQGLAWLDGVACGYLTGEILDVFVFFVQGDGFLSRLIMRISPWSHCGIGFKIRLADGSIVLLYFEALFGKGWRGPKHLSDLHAWAARNPRRKVEVYYLGLDSTLASAKYLKASAMVGKAGYAEWQILAMWWFERFGRQHGWHVPRSERRVVCSEGVVRILLSEIDLRDAQHSREDEVTPGSARDALRAWLDQRGRL